MVFDTTSRNTGVRQGACTRFEQWLKSPLLWLACCHHIDELIAKDCWYELFEEDLGPNNSFFEAFEAQWPELRTDSNVPIKKLVSDT